jgi:hypothetical protein
VEKQKRKQEPGSPLLSRVLRAVFRGIGALLRATLGAAWWLLSKGTKALWSGSVWLFKLPYHLLRYLITGRIPQFENSRQEEIFWRIKRQYRRKRFFAFHLMAYTTGILACIGISISEYFRIQDIMRNSSYAYYWDNFFQMLTAMGFGLGIWTLILFFHFIFNRMGNEEDGAIGAALEQEYARSDYQIERYERLREPIIDDEVDYQSKPKRNGAKS